MIRVTTNGSLMGYKSNLMRSTVKLNAARDKVLTQRKFTSYAEDPASATRAFRLRRNFSRMNDQLSNTGDLINKYQSAWSAISGVIDLLDAAANEAALYANNDPTGTGRGPLTEVMSGSAKSVVQTMNVTFGNSFVFAGNDGLNVPFSFDNNGALLYRGVPVDSGDPNVPSSQPAGVPPNPVDVTSGGAWDTYYQAYPDYAKLVSMTYETTYVDVGIGLKEDASGNLITSSAFNAAISGLDVLGFGFDEDGDPKNSVSIMMQLSELYGRCTADGAFDTEQDQADALRLSDKLQKAMKTTISKWTELDSESNYLNNNYTLLESNATHINEQILDLEQADLADAITDFSWAQYCYNAALQVGNSLLEQSLFDYMR